MANDKITDLSDIRPDGGIVPGRTPSDQTPKSATALSPMLLPIRGEKRIVPSPISPIDANNTFQEEWKKSGQPVPIRNGRQLIDRSDYYIKAAMSPFVDYVYIRLPHRGVGTDKKPDSTIPAVYRFLINPQQVSVSRNTIDGQAMTRAGWQIGVWGEDSVQINLSGKTAGQYWSFGITDRYQEFTESYRNLLMLIQVFENNGYWFEGEEMGEGPLAADFTRRRIKMHDDVELIVGNYIWYGMFEHLTVSQSAEQPHLASFNLSFIAWKERFRPGSPYQNLIQNGVERGHSYNSWVSTAPKTMDGVPSNSRVLDSILNTPVTPPVPFQPQTSATQISESQEVNRATVSDPISRDWTLPPTRQTFQTFPGLRPVGFNPELEP